MRKLRHNSSADITFIFLVVLLIASITEDKGAVRANFATKKIPDHLMKRFPLVDPNRKHVPQHDIKLDDFDPVEDNPHFKKTHLDVPREPEHTIHVEEMHEDDHTHHEQFHHVAREAHHYSLRKRERMDAEERQKERQKNGTADLPDHDDSWKHVEDPNKISKPKHTPDRDDLHGSIVSVFFREKWTGKHDEQKEDEMWMQSNVMALESEFRDHNINFQEIYLPDMDHVQIICNDPEEREHMKHLIIRLQPVLCFMMDGKIIYGKWPAEWEKDNFKGDRDYQRRVKKEAEKQRLKEHKEAMKTVGEPDEDDEPDHTDL